MSPLPSLLVGVATSLHTVHYLPPDRLRDCNRGQPQMVSHKEEEINVNLPLKFFQVWGKCTLESFDQCQSFRFKKWCVYLVQNYKLLLLQFFGGFVLFALAQPTTCRNSGVGDWTCIKIATQAPQWQRCILSPPEPPGNSAVVVFN